MKFLRALIACLLTLQIGFGPILAQPLIQPSLRPLTGNSVSNVRVISQSKDGTEVVLAMDYMFDGFGGQTALLVPVF